MITNSLIQISGSFKTHFLIILKSMFLRKELLGQGAMLNRGWTNNKVSLCLKFSTQVMFLVIVKL